jgi:ABC-2 type transport system permease protein
MNPWRMVRLLLWAGLKSRLEYRVDFVMFVLQAAFGNLLSFFFVWAVLSRFPNLRGWTILELFFLFSLRLLSHGLHVVVFSGVQFIGPYVRQGDFDRILLRPFNTLMQVLLWRYNPMGLGDLITGIICFVLATRFLGLVWTPASLGLLALILAGACLIETALFLAAGVTAFWTTEAQRLNFFLWTLNDKYTQYPLTIYNVAVQSVLTFVLPVAFISYYPATLFLGRTSEVPFTPAFAYITPVVGVIFFSIAYAFWRVGLTHYQSTGS